MPVNLQQYGEIREQFTKAGVTLVAVSKTRSVAEILELYNAGQRDFGENYVQELVEKASQLPKDIRWHFIGHLQSNKVKQIAPFVQLIHSIDSLKLLEELDKQAAKYGRIIDFLLQVHIAAEETKFGLDEKELEILIPQLSSFEHIRCQGLMGMATFTNEEIVVKKEFRFLASLYNRYFPGTGKILSMGMSSDYALAIREGSNMVRIGSLIFGERK